MKTEVTGWVIKGKEIHIWTFSEKEEVAIAKFVGGSMLSWDQHKKKYGYECVKAKLTIEVLGTNI